MNKVYKVIWNASIGAWVATSEIAKGKTKTKSKTLNVSAVVLTSVISFAPNAFAGTNTEGGVGQGTSISGTTSCREGNASTANEKDVAIGCGAQTQDRMGSNIANRNNPYNNSTGAYAGAMKQGGAISVGTGAVVEKGLGTAIGSYATTQGISGVAIGTGALSSGNTALALGRQSAATADFSQAIGNVAAATGKGSLAIGHSATAEGYRSIAIGSPDIENADPVAGQAGAAYQPKMATKATGKDSIAFGGGAVATEENALAIGAFSESKGKKSVAIGTGAKAQKDNAVVIGDQAEATFDGGVAIGKGARSEAENSIALGKDSKAVQATGESFLTKQSAPTGVLSIGDVGSERRIQNVADGAADSDAATIRQLKAARTHYVSINDNGQQGGNFENDGATGRNAIAVGVNTSATAREAMAIGAYAQAAGSGAISMGSSSQTIGRGDVAIGRNASTKGAEGTPSGYSNQSIAIGDQTKAIGDQSVAIGADVIAKGNSSVAIGGDDVDKIARDAELSKTYTEITGGVLKAGSYPTTEANHGSTAVGVQAVGTGAFSSAFGMTSKATGDASSAFGVMSNASGKGAAAFGAVAQATGDGASAMGINSLASGTNSTAIGSGNTPGEGAKATGNSAAAIGSGAQATGDNSAAIGKGAEATNENAAAVGGGAKAKGKNAAAIGGGAIADQENAVAVGQSAQSSVEGGVALGARSKVEAKNSVALGQDAVATEATGSSFLTNRDASKSNGVISVGSAGKERRITNVEDGSADSDAVTVRQLKNVDGRVTQNTSNIGKNAQNITNLNQKLDGTKTDLGNQITETNTKLNTTKDQLTTQINDTKTELNNTIGNTKTELNSKIDSTKSELENKGLNLGNSTANNLGGGSSYDSTTGAVSSPTYVTTKTDGTTVNANNVGDALTNLNNEVVKPITFAGNSGSVDRKLGETLNITGGLTASGSNSNVKTVISGNTVDIQLADAPVFAGKLTANGLDANGEKVTNVGAGTAATDAVNKGQLDALSTSSNNKTDALGNSTANNLGGGSSYDSTTGAVSSPTYTVNGNNVNNVGDAITALDKGWTLQSNGANAAAVKAGDTVDIGTVAGESNLKVTKTGNTIQYGLNRDLNIDSVTAGDSKLDSNGLTIAGGPSVTKTGIDAAGNTITNVAAGTNATDAVNKGQLDHVDNRVTQVTNTTASIFGGGAKANTDGSISNPTYNVAGTSANNVGDALTALDKAVTDAGTAANAGWTISANGDAATAKNIKPNGKVNFTGDDNLTVAQTSQTDNEGNIKVALNKNLKVDSVTTGTTVIDTTGVKVGDNVQLGTTGLIIAGGPSITTSGISAGNKTISNVAAGVSSTDAVNKGQLDSAISSINNNVGALANSAVQYDKNSDGSVNKDSITLAGGANGTTIKNVANGTIAEGSKDAVNGGQLWTVQQQVDKNTGDISNLQTDISNINNGKSGLVQQANKDAAITVGKDTGGTQVNVAGTAGDRTVTGVKAGAVTATSKDAVNGSQLNTTNQALVNYLGGGAGYDNITQSFSNPTYNVGDKSYNNVGDAIGALNQADQTLNTKIDNVSNKLEQAFYATNQRIDDVEKRANAGIAAAMALENVPFVAGKYTYAVGAAYHGGENAVGVTLRKTADNGRWSLTGGVAAASQGDPSVRIGISGVID